LNRVCLVPNPGLSHSVLCPVPCGRQWHIRQQARSPSLPGKGHTALNLSQGGDPCVEFVGQPRAHSLKMRDFSPGQSSPRLPEASELAEQTPALFPRTGPSGCWARLTPEATWCHLMAPHAPYMVCATQRTCQTLWWPPKNESPATQGPWLNPHGVRGLPHCCLVSKRPARDFSCILHDCRACSLRLSGHVTSWRVSRGDRWL
jgi:hypothetical protein